MFVQRKVHSKCSCKLPPQTGVATSNSNTPLNTRTDISYELRFRIAQLWISVVAYSPRSRSIHPTRDLNLEQIILLICIAWSQLLLHSTVSVVSTSLHSTYDPKTNCSSFRQCPTARFSAWVEVLRPDLAPLHPRPLLHQPSSQRFTQSQLVSSIPLKVMQKHPGEFPALVACS